MSVHWVKSMSVHWVKSMSVHVMSVHVMSVHDMSVHDMSVHVMSVQVETAYQILDTLNGLIARVTEPNPNSNRQLYPDPYPASEIELQKIPFLQIFHDFRLIFTNDRYHRKIPCFIIKILFG